MATSARVTVATTATEIIAPSTGWRSCEIRAGGTVFLGGSDVTTTNGMTWDGAAKGIDIPPGESLHGVVSTGTRDVEVLTVERAL